MKIEVSKIHVPDNTVMVLISSDENKKNHRVHFIGKDGQILKFTRDDKYKRVQEFMNSPFEALNEYAVSELVCYTDEYEKDCWHQHEVTDEEPEDYKLASMFVHDIPLPALVAGIGHMHKVCMTGWDLYDLKATIMWNTIFGPDYIAWDDDPLKWTPGEDMIDLVWHHSLKKNALYDDSQEEFRNRAERIKKWIDNPATPLEKRDTDALAKSRDARRAFYEKLGEFVW